MDNGKWIMDNECRSERRVDEVGTVRDSAGSRREGPSLV